MLLSYILFPFRIKPQLKGLSCSYRKSYILFPFRIKPQQESSTIQPAYRYILFPFRIKPQLALSVFGAMWCYILFPFRIKPQRSAAIPLIHVVFGALWPLKKTQLRSRINPKGSFFLFPTCQETWTKIITLSSTLLFWLKNGNPLQNNSSCIGLSIIGRSMAPQILIMPPYCLSVTRRMDTCPWSGVKPRTRRSCTSALSALAQWRV